MFVLAGGVVAGALDITYAWAFWAIKAGVPAQRIFQSVAGGVLGRASFTGGAATAALGLFLHFFIAIVMSIVYYFVARRWEPLHKHPFRYGAIYGLLLYGVMNYIVVPLSAAGGGSAGNRLWIALSIVVHMLFIGIPIAFFTSRAIKATGPAAIV
jgi:ABC-type spermidine/putrescine transport system permease subunit I